MRDKNYEHNLAKDNDPSTTTRNKLINDQANYLNGTGGNFVYGNRGAWYNACEAIAMHNVKVLKGIDSTLSETIYDIQTDGGMLLKGEFGTRVNMIGHIMEKEYGLDSDAICDIRAMYNNGIYIMSFWNNAHNIGDGIHTVAVTFNGTEYTVYNDDWDRTGGYTSKSFTEDEFLKEYGSGFILSYFFKDDENGSTTRQK